MDIQKRASIKRGYFGIGVYKPKTKENIGTLWRSAFLYGASFIFTIGKRYSNQASDTPQVMRHIPLWHFGDLEELSKRLPTGTPIVCIEQSKKSTDLNEFTHPERAVYLLGAEDHGLPENVMRYKKVVHIPYKRQESMNVAMAGSIIMYDRFIKSL